MAGSRLEKHREEIISLLEEGRTQAEIMRWFKQRGIEIPRSTLSDFVRQRQDADMMTATEDDDGIMERYEAGMRFQGSVQDPCKKFHA